MTPLVAVDVGNSRLKWGWIDPATGGSAMRSMPLGDEPAWAAALDELPVVPKRWAIAGSHPARRDAFAAWAANRGEVRVISHHTHVPLHVDVDNPDGVGIDRLLNAAAARRGLGPRDWVVVVDAGTAVTVDIVRPGGVFAGGAILPGPRLMADALHRHTARLPLLELGEVPDPPTVGRDTAGAIRAGVAAGVLGAVRLLVDAYSRSESKLPHVVLTGGALGALAALPLDGVASRRVDPHLTLDGIRFAAEAWC